MQNGCKVLHVSMTGDPAHIWGSFPGVAAKKCLLVVDITGRFNSLYLYIDRIEHQLVRAFALPLLSWAPPAPRGPAAGWRSPVPGSRLPIPWASTAVPGHAAQPMLVPGGVCCSYHPVTCVMALCHTLSQTFVSHSVFIWR